MAEKFKNYSVCGVYFATLLTAALCLALWFITHNAIVVGLSILIVPYFTSRIFNQNVTTKAKILLVILLVFLFGGSAFLFKTPDQGPKNTCDNTSIVDEGDKEDENKQDEELNVEDQKVTTHGNGRNNRGSGKPGSAKPADNEKIPQDFSNAGGDSDGGNVNKGGSKTTAGDSNTIKIEDDKSNAELEKKKKDDIKNGKTPTELGDGITATTDTRPETKPDNNKDKPITDKPYSNIDVEKPTIPVTPSSEPEKIPDPLPAEEQIKEDAQEASDSKLNEMFDSTGGVKTPDKAQSSTTESKKDQEVKPNNSSSDVTNNQSEEKDKQNIVNNDSDKSETKPETKPENNTSSETTKSEVTKPQEAKPEVVKPEETKPQQETPKQEVETKPEESTIPVSIRSLDGGKAYAGDSVQFKITGDVKELNGLDGFVKGKDYTFSNGCLTINTHENEATTITIEVVGVNGTTSSASVEVKVI